MIFKSCVIPGYNNDNWVQTSAKAKGKYNIRASHLEAVLTAIFTSDEVDERIKKRVIQAYIEYRREDL